MTRSSAYSTGERMKEMDRKCYPSMEDMKHSDLSCLGLSEQESLSLHSELQSILSECRGDRAKAWSLISQRLLRPCHPFALHQLLYYSCYKHWDSVVSGPPPAWTPSSESIMTTNIARVLQREGKELLGLEYDDMVAGFSKLYNLSVQQPETYWKMVFSELSIHFHVSPTCILDLSILKDKEQLPGGQWIPGAVLNAAENCLILNHKRKETDLAIIWTEEGKSDKHLNFLTYGQLLKKVCQVANALETLRLPKESALAIDMPMNATAVVIYLALVLAGYVVVSIADSFSSQEISTRLRISNAKAIFTQDVIIRGNKTHPLYSKVVEANSPLAIVIPSNGEQLCISLRTGDLLWGVFLERTETMERPFEFSAVQLPAEATSNILFSSGTTGEPKAIPWTHATPLKAAADAWAHMDIRPGDVVSWPTNLGWMMGPWLVYASLINGAAIALYEGLPSGFGFAEFVQDAKVTMLGLVPSLVRSWKRTDCVNGLDWSRIRCFGSTGEASNADEYLWLMGRAGYKPVIEYCGGTEIGGAFITGSLLQAQSLSLFSTPAMGCIIYILDDSGIPLPTDVTGLGELALDPSLFGASTKLLNANHFDVYFKGMPVVNGKILRRHGDEFEKTSKGYYRAHGRADDTMNLGGIKVSSVEIERVCNTVDDRILETAAIGVPPIGGGPESLLIVVVSKNESSSEINLQEVKAAFNLALQRSLNPLFRISYIASISALPRTASNKVMRRMLRSQFSHLSDSDPSKAKL